MTESETVSQEEKEEVVAEVTEPVAEPSNEEPAESGEIASESSKEIPLHALKKERRKRQELEERLRKLEEQKAKDSYDEDAYEPVTRADMSKNQTDTVRAVEERLWMRTNPEKVEKINELLPEFLEKRPHLAAAINGAPNRYEEAWELMDKLSPKQKKALNQQAIIKKDAPGSPNSIPKAAALNEAVDVMSMSDDEFRQWRQQQRRKRR